MGADLKVIHAYRALYRALLHAVQFSKPARFVARDQLRLGFRDPGATYDYRSIARTVRFLEAAARTRGVEHKVLKNLLVMSYYRHGFSTFRQKILDDKAMANKEEWVRYVQDNAYKNYDMTIAMLNKSLGLCLRS